MYILKALLFALLAIVGVQAKINRNAPHGHTGLLSSYSPGPFQTVIENKDEKNLEKGNPVMKQLPSDDGDELGGKAICIQDVAAPKSAVWNQILDLDSYKEKVNKLKECKNYFVKANSDGTVQIKTKMVIGVMPGYSYENYYDHKYSPKDNSVTWSLDYDKTSDFDDVSGHWHVEDHPKNAGHSRVFYACDLKFKNSLPGPIMSFLQKTALKQATGWVKKESEKKPDADIPKEYQLGFEF